MSIKQTQIQYVLNQSEIFQHIPRNKKQISKKKNHCYFCDKLHSVLHI